MCKRKFRSSAASISYLSNLEGREHHHSSKRYAPIDKRDLRVENRHPRLLQHEAHQYRSLSQSYRSCISEDSLALSTKAMQALSRYSRSPLRDYTQMALSYPHRPAARPHWISRQESAESSSLSLLLALPQPSSAHASLTLSSTSSSAPPARPQPPSPASSPPPSPQPS